MKAKIGKILKSPYWQLMNSAVIIVLLSTVISTCQKTKELDIAINNSNSVAVSNQNEVKVINQSVTKVQKEIANITEAIHQHYSEVITEVFHQQDKDVKIKLISIPDHERDSALFLMLNRIPEPNSIRITTDRGTSVPLTTLRTSRNVIMVQISGLSKLLPSPSNYFEVSYTPNFFAKGSLFSLEDIEMSKVAYGRFGFKLREK